MQKSPRPQSAFSKQGPWTVPMLLSMVSATVICSNHRRTALASMPHFTRAGCDSSRHKTVAA